MTDSILLEALGAAILVLAVFGSLVYTRVRSYRRPAETPAKVPPAANMDALSRYQPLFRLLDGDDLEFLRRNRRCRKVAKQWERSRRRIMRLYLKELAVDFQSLHRQARAMAAQAPEQYPDLVPRLSKQQWIFWRTLLWIDIRLSMGSSLPHAKPENLLAAFEALQSQVSRRGLEQRGQFA